MADAEARINIDINAAEALASIKNLQREISAFHSAMAKGSASAQNASRSLQKDLINNINATDKFAASVVNVQTTAESFTSALEKNRLSLGQYFRYGAAASGKFSKKFSAELETINKTARERVKEIQSQYIQLGRDASGTMKAIKVRPTVLDMDNLATKTQIAAQRQQIFNKLLTQGSTNLLNFGKNTQWAGRQLMVGFTIPLSIFGAQASKTFMDLEKQAIRFRRVYGDAFSTPEETEQAIKDVQMLAQEFTKYGIEIEKTLELAADAAQMGLTGAELSAQITNATRLAVLGEIEQQEALTTSISITNAFGIAAEDLASKIDFLNAVENESITAISDLTTAIPKAAPVVRQLGGNVEDLAFFLTAMKEGGINASEGANALKSGLASLINPTKQSTEMLKSFGINVRGIVEANEGDVKGLVIGFAEALNELDPLKRAQAIEQLFGKFQFSRISTLFNNVIQEGTQAQRVLELANSTTSELAEISERELGNVAESTTFKFQKAVEDLKFAIAPIGEQFLKAVTPILEFGTKILTSFNSMNDGIKNFVVIGGALLAGLGPIFLMTFGLIANGVANIIKGFITVRGWFQKTKDSSTILGEQLEYMSMEQLQAASSAASLERTHAALEQRFTTEALAIERLVKAYQKAIRAQGAFPQGTTAARIAANAASVNPIRAATGGLIRGPGTGTSDSIPAMVSNGEFVVNAERTEEYLPLLKLIAAGEIPKFASPGGGSLVGPDTLVKGFSNATIYLPESINTAMGSTTGRGVASGSVAGQLRSGGAAGMAPLMAAIARDLGMSINDPKFRAEWVKVGDRFADAAATALENSGRQFVKDLDLEEIVVPALKEAAQDIEVGGKKLSSSLDKTFTEIRTASAVGTQSGSTGAVGRVNLGGSYRGLGGQAQRFALSTGNQNFRRQEVPSKSSKSGTKNLFQVRNVDTKEFEMGTMAHIQKSITTTVEKLKKRVQSYLGDVGDKITKAAGKGVVDGANKASKSASPSKEARQAGKNIADGAVQGVKTGVDDAAAAGVKIGEAVAKGASQAGIYSIGQSRGQRRVTTDPNKALASVGDIFKNRDATGIVAGQLMGADKATSSFKDLNSKVMNASMAFSSVAMTMSMFGNDLGGAGEAVFQLSNALFALSAITQLVNIETMKRFAVEKAGMSKAALSSIFTGGFKGSIKNLGGMFKNLFNATKGLLGGFGRLIPFVGIAIGVFQGLQFLNKVQKDAKASVDGMSQSAFLAGEKLQAIADITGFGLSRNPADYGAVFDNDQTGVTQQNIQQSTEISESDAFKEAVAEGGKFYDILQAIKNSSVDDVGTRLTSLMNQMIALAPEDVDVNSVKATMLAIAEAAGKTGISLGPVLLPTGPSNELLNNVDAIIADIDAKVQQTNAKYAPSPTASNQSPTVMVAGGQDTGAAEAEGGRIASVLETIKSAFINGTITFDQYIDKSNQALSTLKGFEGPLEGIAENKIMESFGIPQSVIDGLSSTESKLKAIQLAQIAAPGEKIDFSLLRAVEAGEKIGATADEARNAAIAQQRLNIVYKNAEESIQKLNVGLEATAESVSYEEFELQADALKEVSENSQILLGVAQASADASITEAQARALLTDEIWKEKFAQAQLLDAQSGTSENTEELLRQYQAYQSALAESNLDDELAKSREQNEVYDWLVENGADAGEAVGIIGDQTLYAAAMAAMADGSYADFILKLEELEAISDKLGKGGGPGSSIVETTPFEDAIEQLQKQREEIINSKKAYDGLRKSGMDIATAFEMAQDPIIAAALASKKVGSDEWNKLYDEITLVNGMMEKKGIQDLIKTRAQNIQLTGAFSKIAPMLSKMGLSAQQISDILSNEQLAKAFIKDLEDGKVDAKLIRDYLNQIKIQEGIDIQIRLSTPEGILDEFQSQMSKINNAFAVMEKQIDIDFMTGKNLSGKNVDLFNMSQLQDNVEKYQDEIDKLQESSDDYQYYLDGLEEKEEAINKTYDEREEALSRVATINQDIADAQRAQLSVASALSQGDIAAAAAAIQEKQALDASKAQDKQAELLATSREAALSSVTAKNGMTRAQLEEKIKDLKDQIVEKERDYLTPAQKALDIAEDAVEAAKDQLTYLDKTKPAWEAQENAIALAIISADGYKKKIEEIILKIEEAAKKFSLIGNDEALGGEDPPPPPKKQTSVYQATGVTVLDRDKAAAAAIGAVKSGAATDPLAFANQVKETVLANRALVREGNLSNDEKNRIMKENINLMQTTGLKFAKGGMVPKYFANGGFAKGTDTVPAMLTPGEFVVKRFAVDNFGVDKLKAINNGTYGGDSMYNYNINVSVKTDANPDQIARSVMAQIKQVDNQRIRGNRF